MCLIYVFAQATALCKYIHGHCVMDTTETYCAYPLISKRSLIALRSCHIYLYELNIYPLAFQPINFIGYEDNIIKHK